MKPWSLFGASKSTSSNDAGSSTSADDASRDGSTTPTQNSTTTTRDAAITAAPPAPRAQPPSLTRSLPSNRSNFETIRSSGGGFMSFVARGASLQQEAEMERRVAVAARNLGDGVQRIVMAAKQGSGSGSGGKSGTKGEWKSQLLQLLGGASGSQRFGGDAQSDMDVLLDNSECDKFVLRCVENELPPNLIHCLRLLRVLELQHANAQQQKNLEATAVSSRATNKVSRLLCLLCTDASVGEQLRPHLFGLLALSGASYPPSGVHVARAASEVIMAFSHHCLSTALVWFLHDRKMIIHMTDDVKELCGMTDVSTTASSSLCLYGQDAERAGLWVVALQTVIHLVTYSCNYHCLELLKDFTTAGGYHVLCHAISNSGESHAKKLLELVTILACCKTDMTYTPGENERSEEGKARDDKVATNPIAFEVVEELMVRSVPLLREFDQIYGGERPEISTEESLRELATFSMRTALHVRFTSEEESGEEGQQENSVDLASELLVITLQMYSDHARNYSIIEGRHNILSYYLLAFPTFQDQSLKVLILKTLEYVLTGVAGTEAMRPLTVASEVFFALCKSLLKGANGLEMDSEEDAVIYRTLLADSDMLGGTIEKLLEFDDRVAMVMVEGGLLEGKLNEVLDHVTQVIDGFPANEQNSIEIDGKVFRQPPSETPLDHIFSAMSRVFRLVVNQCAPSQGTAGADGPKLSVFMSSNLNVLLLHAVKSLGNEAATAALSVFESKLTSHVSPELLLPDMDFVAELLDHFSLMTSRMLGINTKGTRRKFSDGTRQVISPRTIRRETMILAMLKGVLERSELAQDVFRQSGGFECITRLILCLEGFVKDGDSNSEEGSEAVIEILEACLALIGAATSAQLRGPSSPKAKAGAASPADDSSDDLYSLVLSNAPARNRHYLRQRGVYVGFAAAVSGTGILNTPGYAETVLNLSLAHMEQDLSLTVDSTNKSDETEKVQLVRNPDGSRLLLGLAIYLPHVDSGIALSKLVLDELLQLCSPDMMGCTLSQFSSCGLCWSLANRKEFAMVLEDRMHHLYSRFVLLLRRLAAFRMSYIDFVAMLRCIAGPILRTTDGKDSRIRLPVISSSIRNAPQMHMASNIITSEAWEAQENDFCSRLESLCVIAEHGDRVGRCQLGGNSLNTISLYLEKVKLEDRLYTMAEDRKLKFLEIEAIDSSSLAPGGHLTAGTPVSSSATGERIWTPMATTGFSYSAWLRLPETIPTENPGSVFLLDISTPPISTSSSLDYLSLWYDIHSQRFTILSSASHRNEPTCFPVSPLRKGIWHHIVLTYAPPRRSVLTRKAVLGMCIDGRPLEADVRVESVNLPPNSKVHIGAPNPTLAASGHVRGLLPSWELGPTLLLSTILSHLHSTAIFTFGPDFEGMFWGDRPQRLSLAATGTAAFAMLAESGEQGSVAGALRKRGIPRLEAAGTVTRERLPNAPNNGPDSDSLSFLGLLYTVLPDQVVFGFRASASIQNSVGNRRHFSRRLVNLARMNPGIDTVSMDAIVYGNASVVAPHSFADSVQWVGGPSVVMPVVNASPSARILALALRLIRQSVHRHPPNLEMLQAGGGYKMLAVLLRQKKMIDAGVLDQCFAYAVHGFEPHLITEHYVAFINSGGSGMPPSWPLSSTWVFSDLDAMKYLLLNHQVWDMRNSGPDLPLRLLSFLNGLVAQNSAHKAFNSRRLHLLGIVRWTLHLMLEAAELYYLGELGAAQVNAGTDTEASLKSPQPYPASSPHPGSSTARSNALAAYHSGWRYTAPSVLTTSVGGDPDIPVLHACKALLRRVLTFMLTPGDLEAIAEAAVYTVSLSPSEKSNVQSRVALDDREQMAVSDRLMPGPVARVYLLRLIEELVVDGVNEIVASGMEGTGNMSDAPMQPHAGGGASTSHSYLSSSMMMGQLKPGADGSNPDDYVYHPKHAQAQAFLSAFAGVLTPVWFACLLEGCHEEASASSALRLMILMLQSSPTFAEAFEEAGGFAPLVLSIPKFSTCPSITISMLSQLLHAHILHLPCLAILDSEQLIEIFDSDSDAMELLARDHIRRRSRASSDPSCGIFALLAECLGRNIQLAPLDNDMGRKSRQSNEAVLKLLAHRHAVSSAFQKFCRTPDFLEPLAQALCLVYDEKQQRSHDSEEEPGASASDTFVPEEVESDQQRTKRRGSLADAESDKSPTERFVGGPEDGTGSSGVGMVHLLRLVVAHSILSGPFAAPLVSALFRSFPIHASPEQVAAFHLVLIEHCRSVVEETLQKGDAVALANCVGVVSVILDRLMSGFFTSEPVLEAVKISLCTLKALTTPGSFPYRTLGSSERSSLTYDTAHLARLTCIGALRRSRPRDDDDEGDADLQITVLDSVDDNIQALLIVPTSTQQRSRGSTNTSFPRPSPSNKIFPLWQSSSLARFSASAGCCMYPDLSGIDDADRMFVVTLMDEINFALFDANDELRDTAVSIVVSLLQHRRTLLSGLLITEVQRGDKMERIDIMNRGGFGALLVAHEAASLAETGGTVPRRGMGRSTSSGSQSTRRKYASFFDWLERNSQQVEVIFQGIHTQALKILPPGSSTPEDAIENEQKNMLLRLTSQDTSDRTILGGLARAELHQRCNEKTSESHLTWKRQGFDDLSSGAMQWKILLRQLKGSCSIWEGGSTFEEDSPFSRKVLLYSLASKGNQPKQRDEVNNDDQKAATEVVKRWKLDLTESYERQRRRLLPNYEFHSLYNLDEEEDHPNLANGQVELKEDEEEEGSDEGSFDMGIVPSMEKFARSSSLRDVSRKSIANFGSPPMLPPDMLAPTDSFEATTALLKELNLKKANRPRDDDSVDQLDGYDENDTEPTGYLSSHDSLSDFSETKEGEQQDLDESARPEPSDQVSAGEDQSESTEAVPLKLKENEASAQTESEAQTARDTINASSYDLITGLLQAGDWPEKSYNVRRCTGLEVRKALLLWSRSAIYIIDGFEQTDGEGLEGRIKRVEKEQSKFSVNLRTGGGEVASISNLKEGKTAARKEEGKEQDASQDVTYQHRSQRIAFTDLYSVFRRRYELQQVGLELFDVHRSGTLVAFESQNDREEVLSKILISPLPNSIFSTSYGTSINYKKFMSSWKSKIISHWVNGKMTNFDFLMHLNSFAGRTYNDLTQYPVFPWIIADYESDEIDLNDPNTYRDLSKSMGAQSEPRAQSFRDRYEALEDSYLNGDGVPPFHYGTHYSCAAYVLYYLMRLEPFSRMAMLLQGGHFDVADRLFHNIGSSWKSASSENVQDVRELIPEFFYLPEFLENSNDFDFGVTQSGKTIHDVTLPPWAKGDPKRFVRINRQALESDFVSKNLHHWVDLVFGCKQLGQEAVKALNVFMHVTYEGEVDLDALEDPVLRASTLAQIQNFGQTPSRLERKPFPQRTVVSVLRDKNLDFGSLTYVGPLTPPFCVIGAPHRVYLHCTMTDTCKVGMFGQSDFRVNDMCLVKGQIVGVGRNCILVDSLKRFYRYGGPNNGVSVHVASATARYREVNKMLSIHDCLHRAPISAAKSSLNGQWLVTGCVDSTVRVWKYDGHSLDLRATLCGHDGGRITCIDVSTVCGTIVTGCSNGNVLLWDLRTLTFVRRLRHPFKDEAEKHLGSVSASPAVSVSINHKNGYVVTLVGSHLSAFDINSNRLATMGPGGVYTIQSRPTCAVSTDCQEWMNGIVAVTGHVNGEIRLWSLDHDVGEFVARHVMPENPHNCAISALRVEGERQDTLLVGDVSGKISVCKTVSLENFSSQELAIVVQELRAGATMTGTSY